MKGDNPSVECTKCKTILHTTNMKMSANRTYKILMYLNQRPYFCCILIYISDRMTPQNCNRNVFPGNNLGFKIPSKYTFKNSRGFCEL